MLNIRKNFQNWMERRETARIAARHREIVEQYGSWTAHKIDLGRGLSTYPGGPNQQWRIDWMRELIHAYGSQPASARLLDLACLEGLFTIAFAQEGLETVGIEIRDTHLTKAEFARSVLNLQNCQIIKGDVREIPQALGNFDIILCAGILYHLDFPDCVYLIETMANRSRDLVIIDSHLAYDDISESVVPLSEMRRYEHRGRVYRGRCIVEHEEHVSDHEKATMRLWSSIDNNISVFLDERDVVDVMARNGFDLKRRAYGTEEYERNHPDRPTLVFKRREKA